MTQKPKIILHISGHDYHPVYAQAEMLIEWLSPACALHKAESLAAFEHLGECDLLVFLGMYFTGWEGRYRPPGEVHQRQFERYIASGGAVILHHGAIASYDSWPRFAQLLGVHWAQGKTATTPVGRYDLRVLTNHPIVENIADFSVTDELYRDVGLADWTRPDVHIATKPNGQPSLPALMTLDERPSGPGRTAYLAPGGNMNAFGCPQVRQLWMNAIRWCLRM